MLSAGTEWQGDINLIKMETPMRLLLAIPFIGLLWIPFYNKALPSLFGFPFFYWYQLLWVPVTAFIIWLVNRTINEHE